MIAAIDQTKRNYFPTSKVYITPAYPGRKMVIQVQRIETPNTQINENKTLGSLIDITI